MPRYKKPGTGRDFLPGNSGGPGRPKDPPELKAIKQMSNGEYKLLMHKLMNLSPEDLLNFKGTVLEMAMASVIHQSIKQGDPSRLQYFTDRLFGKVTDKVEVSAIALMTPREKIAAAKEAILKLESQLKDNE